MKINEAKKMALEISTKHKLFGWKIFFRYNRNNTIGTCWHKHWAMEFNSAYFSVNNEEFCKDTILHETAHALVGLNHYHDTVWQKKCVKIGAVPKKIACNAFPNFKSPFNDLDMIRFAWTNYHRAYTPPTYNSEFIYIGKKEMSLIQEGTK